MWCATPNARCWSCAIKAGVNLLRRKSGRVDDLCPFLDLRSDAVREFLWRAADRLEPKRGQAFVYLSHGEHPNDLPLQSVCALPTGLRGSSSTECNGWFVRWSA